MWENLQVEVIGQVFDVGILSKIGKNLSENM